MQFSEVKFESEETKQDEVEEMIDLTLFDNGIYICEVSPE